MSPRRTLLLAVALLALPPGALADTLRDTGRVVANTRSTVYLDAGRDQGMREGMRWSTVMGGQPVTAVVLAVTATTSLVSLEGVAGPFAAGAELPLPVGRTRPARGPGRRPPPAPSPPWIPSLASGGMPHVEAERRARSGPAAEGPRGWRGPRVRGELAARVSVSADLEGSSRSSEDLGLSSTLAGELGGGWTWDHLFDLHVFARPELPQAPLQNPELRFDVYQARLGWTSRTGAFGAAVGRMRVAPGTDAGMVDGGTVKLVANRAVDVGAWVGVRPAVVDLTPELRAPSAGAFARLGAPLGSGLAAHADVALAVDAWRGALDRAFGSARAVLELPWHTALEAEAVLDGADDATLTDPVTELPRRGRTGVRVTRASGSAQTSLGGGLLDLRATAGRDLPVVTQALVEGLASLHPGALPIDTARWFAFGSADLRLTSALFLRAGARADDGDDGLRSVAGDVGLRILDVGPVGSMAWLEARAISGSVAEGLGGELGWEAPLAAFAHLTLSYAADSWRLDSQRNPSWIHLGRLGLERHFGDHWRSAVSLEAATGGGPPRGFAFLLVGYRL